MNDDEHAAARRCRSRMLALLLRWLLRAAARLDCRRRSPARRHRDPGQCAVPAVGAASGADLRQQAGAGGGAAAGPAAALLPQRKPATPRSRCRRTRARARTWWPTSSASWPGAASMTARPTASMARRPMRRSATSSRRRACGRRPSRTRCCWRRSRARASRRSRPPSAATIRSPRCSRPTSASIAVQRALTDFGYGQIKPTGIHDPETRVGDRAVRARAQAAGDRPGLRPAGARARGA